MAVGSVVPRYALWMYLKDRGWEPEQLSREAAVAFSREHLTRFLAGHRLELSSRKARRLARCVARYEPRYATPEEVLDRLAGTR